MRPIIHPAFAAAQDLLLNSSNNNMLSAEVVEAIKPAQALAAGDYEGALSMLASAIRLEGANYFGRNSATAISAGSLYELLSQSQDVAYGVSNISKRKIPVDLLVYGIQLQFVTTATATGASGVLYNNLVGGWATALQAGEFFMTYNGRVVFNEKIRKFAFDNTVKQNAESEQFYQLPAPFLVKKDSIINPQLALGTTVTAGGSDSVYSDVTLTGIQITVRS